MIDDQTLRVLEFHKVLERIAACSGSQLGRDVALGLLPLADPSTIRQRLQRITECQSALSFDDPLPVGGIHDVRGIVEKCRPQGAMATPIELLLVRETLGAIDSIGRYFERRKEKYPGLRCLTSPLGGYPEIEKAIDLAIDSNGDIKDTASRELQRIRRGILATRDTLRSKLNRILDRLPADVLQDRVVTIREGRFVIPVREASRRKVDGIVHDQSDTGATVFVEPLATLDDGNRLRQLEFSEKRELERILKELSGAIGGRADSIIDDLGIVAWFDFIYAAASLALDYRMVVPVLRDDGVVRLRGARHPLLEARLRRDRAEGTPVSRSRRASAGASPGEPEGAPTAGPVPLDIELGDGFNVLVITGPNAGGKTVALKTLGLLTLMIQCGLPVPVGDGSEMSIFRTVFADIGDEQSIENDLSTFSSHVRRLAQIVEVADSASLVLLDEIGGSTAPDEGAALAMAILEHLGTSGSRTVATTHHGALKSFAFDSSGMQNASMEFDAATLRPTFRLRIGVPGSSYAFEIAERTGLMPCIVSRATLLAGQEGRKVEALVADLEERVKSAESASREAQASRESADRMRREYEAKLKNAAEESRLVRLDAARQAEQLIGNANALIEQTVFQIRSSQAEKQAIKEARAAVRRAESDVREQRQQVEESEAAPTQKGAPLDAGRPPQAGDRVWVARLRNEGIVLGDRGSRGKYRVQIGSAEVEIAGRELERLDPKPRQQHPVGYLASPQPEISASVSVRGMRLEEALDVVDKYLDDAFLARLETVTIIHGKGTGLLRSKIGEFLRKHPFVRSQKLGEWNEGGSGVTVVEMSRE